MKVESDILLLALGSNISPRREHLHIAVQLVEERIGCQGEKATLSRLYETPPVDCPDGSGPFLNAALSIRTDLAPLAILKITQEIELELGRTPLADRERNAPRPVDLDLILLGEQSHQCDKLTLPHPRWQERAFVLLPVRDILPERVPANLPETVDDAALIRCVGEL